MWMLALSFGLTSTSDAETTIDEVYALVDRTPILKSDIHLFQLVGLTSPAREGETPAEYLSRSLDARIRLELQYTDLVDSGSIHRLDINVAQEIEALIARGGGREVLQEGLAANGLNWEDLEALALRTTASRAWVEQHLQPRISVSIEDIENAYQTTFGDGDGALTDNPPPLEEVRDELRQIIVAREVNLAIDRWLLQARQRLEVVRFHP